MADGGNCITEEDPSLPPRPTLVTTSDTQWHAIPGELRTLPRWVLWRLQLSKNGDKPTKIPLTITGKNAATDNPETWGTFDEVIKSLHFGFANGIGLVFAGDGIVGIDIDHCRDPGTGDIDPVAWSEITRLNSYAEVSPSGTGVHVMCRGIVPGSRDGMKAGYREVYQAGRYLTVTGNHIPGTPTELTNATAALEDLCAGWFPPPLRQVPSSVSPDLDDDEIIRRASAAANGAKFASLMRGDISGYPSGSEADAALVGLLSFWTQDKDQIVRIVQQSALWDSKWERQDYQERTIGGILSRPGETYQGFGTASRQNTDVPSCNGDRKIIVTGYTPKEIADTATRVINLVNDPPFVFLRCGDLAEVRRGESDQAFIKQLNASGIRGLILNCCDFYSIGKKGAETPTSLSRDVVDVFTSRATWPFPVVEGIAAAPIIHKDGSIFSIEGYDKQTRLYYAPPVQLVLPPVPNRPTGRDIEVAVSLIREPFIDFPLVDETSRTHILAALITPIVRHLIAGPVPMCLIDKPSPGTGASLIAELIAIIATGNRASMMTAPREEAEWKKSITSILLHGAPLVILDNVEYPLRSPGLAAAITAPGWEDRILGKSETVNIKCRTTWIANGNNLTLGGDLPRRCYWSHMDALSDRPWQRNVNYTHSDVAGWTLDNRGPILSSVLTVVRAWICAGCPPPSSEVPKLGGFEDWRKVIGGILAVAGIPGFLGNLEALYERMDTDGTQWDGFVQRWFEIWGDQRISVATITNRLKCENNPMDPLYQESIKLADALPDDLSDAMAGKGSSSRKIGRALAKRKDRIFSGRLKLMSTGTVHSAAMWKVVRNSATGSETPQTPLHIENTDNSPSSSSTTGELGELGEFGTPPNAYGNFKKILYKSDREHTPQTTQTPPPQNYTPEPSSPPCPTHGQGMDKKDKGDPSPCKVTASLRTCGYDGPSGPVPSAATFQDVPPDRELKCLACGKGSHTRSATATRDRTGRLIHKSVRTIRMVQSGNCILCESCRDVLRYEQIGQGVRK